MNGDSATRPTSPPPGPRRPGSRVFGWDELKPLVSPQHAVSVDPSSNVIKISPPSLYAGDAMISGTQVARNLSICARPPGWPVTQGASCPSLHRFGEIHEKAGVVLAAARSPRSGWNDSTCAAQYLPSPVTERKYMNPSRRGDSPVAGRVVPHVLHVRRPGQLGGRQLVAEGGDGLGENASALRCEHLVVRPDGRLGRRHPDGAVLLGQYVRRLAGDLRDVVVRAVVPDRVVAGEQRALLRQRLGEIRVGGRVAEALRVAEVLELDDPDVPDGRRPGLARRRETRRDRARGGAPDCRHGQG